ncbi:2-phosphosulfolactate phosphatase [Glaciihabitans sp. UYNi722]|uniref:2-phosphosulfolactate phosphatase n=1 Tax=Glaciihabitans sp. UYNi722 TaxID=3156344 RepID=UPI003396D575
MTHGQTQYQVRFDWGVDGLQAIGEAADVAVWVDVLDADGSTAVESEVPVVRGSLRNRRAVAEWVLAQQGGRGERFMVAIVAAGERWAGGGPRFAVEDLLAAGAIIDALADLGIDYCSPEAAAAAAAFTGLRNATGHLIGASASGRTLVADGRRTDIEAAIELDVSSEVQPVGEFDLHA